MSNGSKAEGLIFNLWRASFNLDFLIFGKKRNNCRLSDILSVLSYAKCIGILDWSGQSTQYQKFNYTHKSKRGLYLLT